MINLYTNSTIGSYTTGTVTCTKNSANVTGSGTTWSEIVNPGDILTLNDDKLYVIKTVNSNTSITLDKNFAENTVSNSAYRIFLNTAAHFPSDTAAKVERALEQLSDINEAAINNNRTVTAATYINGKGLTSTAGTIDLNPPTVNSNTGGAINFHYNQASSATSSIYENQSGRIRLDGDVEINGYIHGSNGIINSRNIYSRCVDLGTGIRPTTGTIAQRWDNTIVFNNEFDNKTISSIYNPLKYNSDTDWQNSIQLLVYDLTQKNRQATLQFGFNQNGVFTLAPTPATNDNSGQIATTAFVNNRLPCASGTWTPVLTGATNAGVFTYIVQSGYYTKFKDMVYISCRIMCTCTTHPEGEIRITGLPYKAVSDSSRGYMWYVLNARCIGGADSGLNRAFQAMIPYNDNIMRLRGIASNSQSISNLTFSSTNAAGHYIQLNSNQVGIDINGVYRTSQ